MMLALSVAHAAPTSCDERRVLLRWSDVSAGRALPDLHRGGTVARRDGVEHALWVGADGGWTLDGRPVDALPSDLRRVAFAMAPDAPASEVARVFEALSAVAGPVFEITAPSSSSWPCRSGRDPSSRTVELPSDTVTLREIDRSRSSTTTYVAADATWALIHGADRVVVGEPSTGAAALREWTLGSQVMHAAEMQLRTRVLPTLSGGEACQVRVFVGPDGVPDSVVVDDCAEPLRPALSEAVSKWRWASRAGTAEAQVTYRVAFP